VTRFFTLRGLQHCSGRAKRVKSAAGTEARRVEHRMRAPHGTARWGRLDL